MAKKFYVKQYLARIRRLYLCIRGADADIRKKQLTSKLEHYRILLFSLVTIKGIKKKKEKKKH